MAEFIDLQVFCEDTNEIIILKVQSSDIERARNDIQYLGRLVNEEYERRSLMAINQESQNLTGSDNDHTQTEEGTANKENETSIFIWTPECVHLLLSLYEEHEAEFKTGTKRQINVWETIAMLIEKHGYIVTWGQCQSKMNGLKKTYKKILDLNNVSGNDRMTWPYFKRMDEIFGKSSWVKPRALATEAGPNENVSTARRSSPNNNTGEPKT